MSSGFNSSFSSLEAYQAGETLYRLLPMRFLRLDSGRYVVTNLAGNYRVIEDLQLRDLIGHRVERHSRLYDDLKASHLIADSDSEVYRDLLAAKYRTRHAKLPEFTALHMFVVTLRCDHSCQYCQVSRVSEDRRSLWTPRNRHLI